MLPRRGFLKTLLAAGAAPTILRAQGVGSVRVGLIGLGSYGINVHYAGLKQTPRVRITDVCDVNKDAVAAFVKSQENLDIQRRARTHYDYRNLLAGTVDAVALALPEHWQFDMAAEAFKAGKDVLLAPPFSFAILESAELISIARRNGRHISIVSDNYSSKLCKRVCERIQDGLLGMVQEVRITLPAELPHVPRYIPKAEPPETLDYGLWCGPVPEYPYSAERIQHHPYIRAHAGGPLTAGTDWIILALRALFASNELPQNIEVTGEAKDHGNPLIDVYGHFTLNYRLDDRLTLSITNGDKPSIRFRGEKSHLELGLAAPGTVKDGERYQIIDAPDYIIRELHRPQQPQDKRLPATLAGAHQAFADALRYRELTPGLLECANHAAQIAHLGNICLDYKTPLEWNIQPQRLTNDKINRLLPRTRRSLRTLSPAFSK